MRDAKRNLVRELDETNAEYRQNFDTRDTKVAELEATSRHKAVMLEEVERQTEEIQSRLDVIQTETMGRESEKTKLWSERSFAESLSKV